MSKDFDLIAKIPLPDDVCSREMNGRWLVIYIRARAPSCTIDVTNRCVRAGYNVLDGEPISAEKYTGRGWHLRLHADAVAWLRASERAP